MAFVFMRLFPLRLRYSFAPVALHHVAQHEIEEKQQTG